MNMAFHISFLILKPLLLLTLSSLTYTRGCVDSERLALLDFKKSFASFSENDAKLSSWNSSEDTRDCCTWEGITCDDHLRHVVSLDLSFQDLKSYQLRPSLLQLQYLGILDLSYNNLAMTIPKFIGCLSELISLQLTDAGFFGTIPPQLGNLSKIRAIDLSSNKLSADNIQWLSHLSSLESLDMSNLNISEARDWVSVIRKLPILSYFTCLSCYFPTQDLSSIVIHHVNSSSSLQTLRLGGSHLSTFSLSSLLVNCTILSDLDLDGLELDVPFPDIFHDLMSLEALSLSNNHLEDGIFNSIGNLCNLSILVAYGSTINQSLANILQALSGCASSSLEALYFSSMNLTGTIPPMLNFKSLIDLELSYNCLDNFSLENGKLFLNTTLPIFPASLSSIYLDNNNLNGLLTDLHFTNLSNLECLVCSGNSNLTVSFDRTLPKASQIELRSCNLGPGFPSWLLSHHSIEYLDISHSKISGTVPFSFWRNLLPSLVQLNLSSNSLSGEVPNIAFQFSNMESIILDLTSNAFSGPIPFFFFRANVLYLSKNNFSGFASIPHPYNSSIFPPRIGYSYESFVNVVDLSNNLLSGFIPYWLGFEIPNLGALILSNNNLSGTIPSSIGYNKNLFVLSLRNNSLSGSLPSLLKNCSQLRILDLGWNRFSGFIPSWIGKNLKNLSILSLTSNNFTGILSTDLCHLSSLQILDASHNLLSGNIPSCIQNFTAMARDVSSSLNVTYVDDDTIPDTMPLDEVSYFNAYITWKSRVWQFQHTLHLVKLIDLSSNNFSGEIPKGLATLVELGSIDLSCNSLQGSIPGQIGQIMSLQVLNLSHNRLYGQIPPSLSQIYSLEMLDLSHNNLSGRIPKGTQLQSFDPSDFAGNSELCGLPLGKCPGDDNDSTQYQHPSPTDESEMEDKWADKQYCFYGGLGTGFTFGFLGIIASLTWISKWRYAFFQFATQFGEWILLMVALTTSKISRKIQLK